MYKFDFTKQEYDFFVDNCFFSEREELIFYMRQKSKSIIEISLELNVSESTVKRTIKNIHKKIYKIL
jgi:DNA-binding NarL/FixJ family response regulator